METLARRWLFVCYISELVRSSSVPVWISSVQVSRVVGLFDFFDYFDFLFFLFKASIPSSSTSIGILIEFFYPFLLFSLPLVAYLCFSLSFFTVLASPTPDSTIFFLLNLFGESSAFPCACFSNYSPADFWPLRPPLNLLRFEQPALRCLGSEASQLGVLRSNQLFPILWGKKEIVKRRE